MPKELRAQRYVTAHNQGLVEFITRDLPFLDYKETSRWYLASEPDLKATTNARALLGCNDRFYLLTALCGRADMMHPWVFDRCREVEADPDGHLDLWARGHFKSTVITFGGVIQDFLCDPEIKTVIFSVVKPIAQAFLAQIKDELEQNETLKEVYADVLYQNPRTLGPDGRPSKWSLDRGITIKRKGNPKEATVEAHGLIDGQPTSRHFEKQVFDDIVTQDYLSDEQIRKCMQRWEMADNLGTHHLCRKQVAGTYYHFNDPYVQMRDRGSLKPRVYPATDNGKMDGKPVLLSQERWDRIKRDQRTTVSAQMLLDPVADNEATFRAGWLRSYELFPAVMNVYILVDPSKGTGERSDRSAIAVIGIDQGGNKYLLDGVCHRMKLSERYEWINKFKRDWEKHYGVQMVHVGYERYGMQVDLEVIEDMQLRDNNFYPIKELNTPHQGGHSKNDRISRLEPDIREGRFLLPCVAWHPDFGAKIEDKTDQRGWAYWHVISQEQKQKAIDQGRDGAERLSVDKVLYRPWRGMTRVQAECVKNAQHHRIPTPIKRFDEQKVVYDLARVFMDELVRHPFAAHDDLIDVCSRIYDMDPQPPFLYEVQSTEALGTDAELDG
jgi:hypothetical protein